MKGRRLVVALLLAVGGILPAGAAVALAQTSTERVRAAKELFFDKKYDEARRAWQAVADGKGAEAESASYWVARCSENLGELERAYGEYDRYLARPPADRAQAEEARTGRVGLAARLYKAGNRQHLSALTAGLDDASKTVRYYAALQLAGLGPEVGRPAIPVLKRIVTEEKDDDLVERAKLSLLRLEPRALGAPAPSSPRSAAPRAASFIRVRVYGRGKSQPEVAINLPVALAELVFKSLPDEARQQLRLKGIDADNFWDKLKKLGPTEIIDIQGDDGEKVQIWME